MHETVRDDTLVELDTDRSREEREKLERCMYMEWMSDCILLTYATSNTYGKDKYINNVTVYL